MPRKRASENKGFPTGWRLLHGAIYYSVPKGFEHLWDGKQLFRLGKNAPEAYRIWAERIDSPSDVETIGKLLDRYAIEIVPTKAPKSQTADKKHMQKIRKAFGHMHLIAIKPRHIYKYRDARTAKVSAKREIALLSHAFTMAVEWGYIDQHPFKGQVRLKGEKPRSRILEQWEIDECLKLEPVRKSGSVLAIQAYIMIKTITGIRRVDILRIKATDAHAKGVEITPSKTENSSGKSTIYKWTPGLRAAWEVALKARPVDISPWLFCNKHGECYLNEETGECHGWESMWKRFMIRVLAETKVKETFTESDMRSKVSDDAKTLEHARALLSHSNSNTTNRVYRRKAEVVRPLK